ncbi:MAG: PAS domain-containing protein, partial [Massilia sp.]|nr:PAS domain-containing protein [Massilia sp.]
MAHVIRHTDWQATAVGAIGGWPASLRTAVTTVLDSPLPTVLLWGQELLQIYNDAYCQVLEQRHPVAMGQATRLCWPEVWHFNAPIYAGVLGSGERVHLEDQEYLIEPSGVRESRFFTITYAPARDETGAVRGVFVLALETTRRVLAERDNAALLKDAGAARDQLRQMFDQAPGFMALLRGPEHVFELANETYLRVVGQRDIIGKSVRDAIPGAQKQGFIALLDAAYASGTPFVASRMPFTVQHPVDGAHPQRYLDFVYKPMRDADGQVRSIFVEGNDVTAQYHQQKELERLNEVLEDKVRSLEKAERRQQFQLDLAERLRQVTPQQDVASSACQLLGEFLGVSRVVFCEVDDAHGTFLVRCEWLSGGVKSVTGASRALDDFGADNIAVLRAGAVFACDDTASDSRTAQFASAYAKVDIIASLAIPLIQAGKLTIILNVQHSAPRHWSAEDIELAREMAERTWSAAESARAKAELRQERDQSHYIFDNMAAGFAMIDQHWCVVHMNAEGLRLGQRNALNAIGSNHWEVWPETLGTPLEAVYRRVLATGVAETLEQDVPLSATTNTWLEVRVHRTLSGELAIFFHDISDRKNIETTLTEVARHKDEFLAMLA